MYGRDYIAGVIRYDKPQWRGPSVNVPILCFNKVDYPSTEAPFYKLADRVAPV